MKLRKTLKTKPKNDAALVKNRGRRKAFKQVFGGGSLITLGATVPNTWVKPVIDMVLLPTHAQTSSLCQEPIVIDATGPFEIDVPACATTMSIELTGGGGGGAGSAPTLGQFDTIDYGRGGNGGRVLMENINVIPGQTVSGLVAAGGNGGGSADGSAAAGGAGNGNGGSGGAQIADGLTRAVFGGGGGGATSATLPDGISVSAPGGGGGAVINVQPATGAQSAAGGGAGAGTAGLIGMDADIEEPGVGVNQGGNGGGGADGQEGQAGGDGLGADGGNGRIGAETRGSDGGNGLVTIIFA